jgi:hypothetical protein
MRRFNMLRYGALCMGIVLQACGDSSSDSNNAAGGDSGAGAADASAGRAGSGAAAGGVNGGSHQGASAGKGGAGGVGAGGAAGASAGSAGTSPGECQPACDPALCQVCVHQTCESRCLQRPAWQTVHDNGGKVFVAGAGSELMKVADILDTGVVAYALHSTQVESVEPRAFGRGATQNGELVTQRKILQREVTLGLRAGAGRTGEGEQGLEHHGCSRTEHGPEIGVCLARW